ncbi:MAG: hypothetical protein PVI99_08390, partial [Anaerolineales bacterium]
WPYERGTSLRFRSAFYPYLIIFIKNVKCNLNIILMQIFNYVQMSHPGGDKCPNYLNTGCFAIEAQEITGSSVHRTTSLCDFGENQVRLK